MLDKKYVIAIVVTLLACSTSSWLMTRVPIKTLPHAPPPPPPRRIITKKPAVKKTRAPATTAPTTSPALSQFVYPDYIGSVLAPLPPAPQPLPGNIILPPSFMIVPGANVPGVTGLTRDRVTTYLATSFPRLVVRAVPYGNSVMYEPRTDRITVSYDINTNRVISARVG
jgi:hypothetical protein